MARTPREDHALAPIGRIVRAGAVFAVAAALATSVATFGSIGSDGPTPARIASAADVRLDRPSAPVRIRVPSAGIDLPVISSERRVSGNRDGDTPCDVALYWTKYRLPGKPGTTWIYAHAQPGMFLPLFTTSEATGGTGLIGDKIELQLRDGRLLTYRITEVKERATGERIALRDKPGEHRLVLQTSTGPEGTKPKLQVAAVLVDAGRATEKAPKARPRACWQPRASTTSGTKPGNGGQATSAPGNPDTTPGGDDVDGTVLAVGTGAILLGATLIAVILIRRQP